MGLSHQPDTVNVNPNLQSHPNVPLGWIGQFGIIPGLPDTVNPTIHPIPMYHWGGLGNLGLSQVYLTLFIPTVHPIPMYRWDRFTTWDYPRHCLSQQSMPYQYTATIQVVVKWQLSVMKM